MPENLHELIATKELIGHGNLNRRASVVVESEAAKEEIVEAR